MRLGKKSLAVLIGVLAMTAVTLLSDECSGRVLDRVAASVDDRAITLTEFQDAYAATRAKGNGVSAEEVIDSMINHLLLIKEARKVRLEAPSDDDLLKEFIEVKIRAPIIIRDDAVRAFYESHQSEFGARDFLSLRDEIEQYLFELETTRRLKEYLEQLRKGADIRIQLLR